MRPFLILSLFFFSLPLFAADPPATFVEKDTKFGRLVQWFERGDLATVEAIKSIAAQEVDIAAMMKEAGYAPQEGSEKWNKLAWLKGVCVIQSRPELVVTTTLGLKNLAKEGKETTPYLFPTWDRDADYSAINYKPLHELADGIPSFGVDFYKGYSTNEKREYFVTPVIEDNSLLVKAATFTTRYSETYTRLDGSTNGNGHTMNYELRKVIGEEKTYYVLKEILVSSSYSEEMAFEGHTVRYCLFSLP